MTVTRSQSSADAADITSLTLTQAAARVLLGTKMGVLRQALDTNGQDIAEQLPRYAYVAPLDRILVSCDEDEEEVQLAAERAVAAIQAAIQ